MLILYLNLQGISTIGFTKKLMINIKKYLIIIIRNGILKKKGRKETEMKEKGEVP
jgi:hypothetical protein